jgi:hypothetical protein
MFILLVFCAIASTKAQNGALQKSSIKVNGKNQQLILSVKGKTHRLNLKEHVDAAKLTSADLLFFSSRESFNYLVVSTCGPSKMKPDDRQCGAGTECNLMWLKMTSDWQASEIKSIRYESCWQPITSDEGYKVTQKGLELEYSDLREKKQYKVTYEADKPEQGFKIEESLIEA